MSDRKEYKVSLDSVYASAMAKELSKYSVKNKPTTEQAPSTQTILARPESEDVPMWQRTDKPGWKADRYAMRPITKQEGAVYHKMQHRDKRNDVGLDASDYKGVSEIAKYQARLSFMNPARANVVPRKPSIWERLLTFIGVYEQPNEEQDSLRKYYWNRK